MVEVALDHTDAGSVATILEGDVVVVRLQEDRSGERWTVEDSGTLSIESSERVLEPGMSAPERRIRLRAVTLGRTTVRLALVAASAGAVEALVFTVEVSAPPPSFAHKLLRKKQ